MLYYIKYSVRKEKTSNAARPVKDVSYAASIRYKLKCANWSVGQTIKVKKEKKLNQI